MATLDIDFSLRRICAIVLRHLYLMRTSWPRVLEMIYWPTVQMVLWGFITLFLKDSSSYVAQATGILLSAVLLWDVLFRGQLGIALVFMEEMWSRNLAQLFVSPLRPYEMVASLILMSLIRTLIGVGGAALVAIPLFDYNIFNIGLPLIAFFTNLIIMGWAIGLLVSGIVMRYGLGAESVAWIAVFAIQPICAIYYPVAVLPEWLQPIAWSLPASHVFEGMRQLLLEHTFNIRHLFWAMALNALYLAGGIAAFLGYFRAARQRGLLLHSGE
ncbi:MAG TPA: ABC transporter permease [Methylophilaceae bacterium]|nr:ABC transporter permease [Methylophilaceae bacterium]